MGVFGEKCIECGHPRERHQHYNCIWVEKEEDERVIDKEAEKMYHEAESEKFKKEAMKAMALKAVDELTRGIEEAIAQVGSLATEYANLSLETFRRSNLKAFTRFDFSLSRFDSADAYLRI